MGGKASGKKYTSQGQRSCVSSRVRNGARRDRDGSQKLLDVQRAWLEGRNPWVTMDNPNKEQTNRRKIRVKANTLWGSPKERDKKMYVMK
jgi:hypothetical protein